MKPGYQVHVESWENDGDNSKTDVTSGLSEADAGLLVFLASAFQSRWSGEPNEFNVAGNDSNSLKDLAALYKEGLRRFPGVSEKYVRKVPSDEILELYSEYEKLSYNSTEKNDSRFAPFSKSYDNETTRFANFINELLDGMLGYPGEGYWDETNFKRVCESVKVFYIPGVIEDVTEKFIPTKKGKK